MSARVDQLDKDATTLEATVEKILAAATDLDTRLLHLETALNLPARSPPT